MRPGSINGFAQAALVADALERAGRAPSPSVRELAARALVFVPNLLGLCDGAAGLLVVIDALDPRRKAFVAARQRLAGALAAWLDDPPAFDFDEFSSYDLISGAAGRALALRDREPAALTAFAAYAQRFADAVEARLASTDRDVRAVNLGVAHGIPGMLAAINLALPGERALARRFVELLLAASHRVNGVHRWGAIWLPDEPPPAIRSWCYGTVGVAAVLYDRAVLDGDDALRALAVAALDGVLDDERGDPPDFLASLCHGRAGPAVVAWHLASEGARFIDRAARFAEQILGEYDERLPLGYHAYDTPTRSGKECTRFLDGAFGIALVLVDAVTAQERRWLPLLGLLPD